MHIGKKGFTLVEIIVSLAIMTIVAGAVGAFMVAGNNSYMRGNKELTLQEEAQLTANQIIDMIIDVEKSINFTKSDDGTTSELFLENEKNSYLLQWRQGSGAADPGKVYFYESDNTQDADGNLAWSSESLLAEYVTKFDVDLTGVKNGDNTVILRMDFAYQDKNYSINETIRLRNDLSAAKGTDYIWISGLQVSPKNPSVKQSDSLNFSYRILGDPEAAAEEMAKPDPVTWKVEYYNNGGTPTPCKSTIDSKTGRLTIAADELVGNNILLVTCTLNSNPTFKDTALVNVLERKVLGLTITPKEADIERGSSGTFTYTLTGTQAGMDAGVTWKVERVNGAALASGTEIKSTGDGTPTSDGNGHLVKNGTADLTVGTTERNGTYVLRVTCTSNADSDYYDTALVTVSVIKGQYTVELIPDILTTYEFTESGEERMGYKVNIECLPSWADYANGYPKITWEVVGNASGYILDPFEEDESNIYKHTLYCSTNINTVVTIRAKVQLDAENWYYPTLDIQIPDLQKAKDTKAPYIDSDQFVLYRNGMVKCQLKDYKGDMSQVQWIIANDAELGLINPLQGGTMTKEQEEQAVLAAGLDGGKLEVARMPRVVGFSQGGTADSYGSFPSGYDSSKVPKEICGVEDASVASRSVYSTATGEYAYVWAKWYLDWTKEYRLKLQAWKTETDANGAVKRTEMIAQTDLLIPEVTIYFPEGMRSKTYNQSDYSDTDGGVYDDKVAVTIYGYANGKGGLNLEDPRIAVTPYFYDSNGVKIDDQNGTSASKNWKFGEDAISIYISKNEPNSVLFLKFSDARNISINRILTVYWNKVNK